MEDRLREIMSSIEKNYEYIGIGAERDLEQDIKSKLGQTGIMFRVFSRKKSKESIKKKMEKKACVKYIPNNKKMQDIIGIRIVLYFKDDIDICIHTLCKMYNMVDKEHDVYNAETFKPQRINYVFKMPERINCISEELSDKCAIDNTFEVQIRTIFSEGWHEVEHDIRYKYQEDWNVEATLSRELNGLFAVLEVCDNGIIEVCDSIAYKKYKAKQWESMIRNHFRLRFLPEKLSPDIVQILNNDNEIAKSIFRYEREDLISLYEKTCLPINYNNVVYLINESLDAQKNSIISNCTPETVKRKFKHAFKKMHPYS